MEKAKFKHILRNKPKVPALVTHTEFQERWKHVADLVASCLEYEARAHHEGKAFTLDDLYNTAEMVVVGEDIFNDLGAAALAKLRENLGLPPG